MGSRKKQKANAASNGITRTSPEPVGDPVANPGRPAPSPNGWIGTPPVADLTLTGDDPTGPVSSPIPRPSSNGTIDTRPTVDTVVPGGDGPDASARPSPEPSSNGCIGTAQTGGRDAGGRFARGNRGGTGNPHAKQVARLRAALLHGVTEDDIQKVARKLLDMAVAGDLAAAKLLFQYTIGKPANVVDPDDVENGVDLFRRLEAMPSVPEGLRSAMYTISGQVLAELAERFLGNQNVDNLLELVQKEREILVEVADAQRRRVAG